ncbi:MAG: glycosyltransferase [Planctomyces sp.]
MRILFLSSGPLVPSSRFRIQPWVQRLRQDGHRAVVLHSFPRKYDYFPWMGFRPSQLLKRSIRWWHWLRTRLQRFDLVFIDREIFDNETLDMEQRFRESCGRLVLDLDDAVFLRYPQKFARLVPLADLVVCGNRYLEEWARPLNSRLLRIPTCVELSRYELRSWSAAEAVLGGDCPVSGWMGTTVNLQYLSEAAPALKLLAAERRFELRLVVPDASAARAMDLGRVHMTARPWQAATEISDLQQFDIGLMPLSDREQWAVYKCGLKLIQYLAVGVPGVASAVGVNAEILEGNRGGFAVRTCEEWLVALRRLLDSRELRQQQGLAGRRLVEQQYAVEACYPRLRDALLQLVSANARAGVP